MMIHKEKPSLEEAIEHFGVKGMRWGVRRSDAQLAKAKQERVQNRTGRREKNIKRAADQYRKASGSKVATKKSKKIYEARANLNEQALKVERAKLDVVLAKTAKGRSAATKTLKKEYGTYINSQDQEMANKMSTGEKAAFGVWGATTSIVISPLGAAAYLGTVAALSKAKKSRVEKDKKRFNETGVARL